jgi:Sec7-like guanine-nucleotide exchange factor
MFDFKNDPLDVSLRKLLMDVTLPRETQQIDRVIEAFARRYLACNPSLFISDGLSSFTHIVG